MDFIAPVFCLFYALDPSFRKSQLCPCPRPLWCQSWLLEVWGFPSLLVVICYFLQVNPLELWSDRQSSLQRPGTRFAMRCTLPCKWATLLALFFIHEWDKFLCLKQHWFSKNPKFPIPNGRWGLHFWAWQQLNVHDVLSCEREVLYINHVLLSLFVVCYV